MSGFFSNEQTKNKAADEPWKRTETDRMLDLYLGGAAPQQIAVDLKRNPKAIKRRLEQFTYNERGWVDRYEPRQRLSRKGKRITQNETVIIASHRERGLPIAKTAQLLARSVSELGHGTQTEVATVRKQGQDLAPTLDLIWAYRYIFFVYKEQTISNETYDRLVEEEIEYGGGGKAFLEIKNHQGWPDYIKALAQYLHGRKKEGNGRCQECSVKITTDRRKRENES